MIEFLTGGGGILAVIAAAIAVVAGAFFSGRSSGINRERARGAKHAVKQWRKADEIIGEANEARIRSGRNSDTGGLYDDDGNKRT